MSDPGPDDDEPRAGGLFVRSLVLVLLLGVGGAWLFKRYVLERSLLVPDAAPRIVTARGDLAADELATIELFEKESPAVVNIDTKRYAVEGRALRLVEVPEGTGSGFLWDEQGHVVTNFHVIQGADKADVTLSDGSLYRDARLVGFDADYDLAVLVIDAPRSKLLPLPIGTSSDLRVGQKVFAIGSPFNQRQTLTTGVISGLNREMLSVTERVISGVIQTDAAINPGNSGGPLLDSAGRLIGVNTAIKSTSGSSAGIGFAIPVDTVNRVVPRVLREGVAERAALGISLATDERSRAGVDGALVRGVLPGGAADAAGMELGDVIIELDGRPIHSADDLTSALEEYRVGDVVRVQVSRGRSRVEELSVKLQSRFQ